MIQAPDLPVWAAFIVALLVLAGGALTLIGSLGLLRMKSFYDRVHPPTLGSTMGMALIVLGSIVCFSVLRSRLSVHELLIGIFVTLTTPVTFMLLARAALYRDRAERRLDMPPADSDIVSDGETTD
jgi:multicomponent K+:H+ antiporter subunit G